MNPSNVHAGAMVPPTRPRTIAAAWQDWWAGTARIHSWLTLAWYDILLRYRRSLLGPLWLTLSMGAMILGMGPLYGALFGVDLHKFLPHLALGIIFWTFFSTIANEACTVFVSSANYLKQGYFPISLFVWRMLARNLIQFAHQIILYVPVAIWAGVTLHASVWMVIPAFILLAINAHATGILIGLLATKFRDLAQIVASVMLLLMFLTPVFWMPETLPERSQFVLWNPFAMMLDLLRTPLMGGTPQSWSWTGVLVCTLANVLAAAFVFKRYRRRIVYWL